MPKYITIAFLIFFFQDSKGQVFSSTGSANVGGTFGYLSNVITVSNLGNLDGVSLGVTELEITMTANGPFGFGNASLQLYLVAPNGFGALVFLNSVKVNNGKYIFNLNPTSKSIKYLTVPVPDTYFPYGNFNSLNQGTTANGVWKLYARQDNFATVTVSNWKVTFGNVNLNPGSPNQSLNTAIALPNNTTTGNFATGNDIFHGIVVGDSKGSEVGSGSPLTERTIWYSFTPKCKNDKIEITNLPFNNGDYSYINSGILNAGRVVQANADVFHDPSVYTYSLTNYIPGNTYYLVMDSDEADTFFYQVKWFEGTVGCPVLPTIITTDQTKAEYCANSPIPVSFSNTGVFNSGNRFTAQLSDTNFSFVNPITLGFIDGTSPALISGTLPSGLKPGKSYKIRVTSSNPAQIGTINSGFIFKTVPSIPSDITGKNSVCQNESGINYSVTSTTNALSYKWKTTIGAVIVSSNADSSSIQVNFSSGNAQLSVAAVNECGDSPYFSKPITITPLSTPTASINSFTTRICQGDAVQISSLVTNEGSNPVYNWKLNNAPFGSGPTISINNLKNKDSISLMLTSDALCSTKTAVSNTLKFTVNDTLNPVVTILGSSAICKGNNVSFVANTKNRGSSPVFQWYINKTLQNSTDSLFQSNTLSNKDTVWVMLQSNALCAKPALVKSNFIVMKVFDTFIPTVEIEIPKTFCKGNSDTLTAKFTNGGNSPSFEWFINGESQGSGIPSLISSAFQNGNSVKVKMQSDLSCAVPDVVESTLIQLSVLNTVENSVKLSGDSVVCKGQTVSISYLSQNTGTNPIYTWKLNNVQINNSAPDFTQLPSGTHLISLTVRTSQACSFPLISKDSLYVLVKDSVQIKPFIEGDTIVCQGSNASLFLSNNIEKPNTIYDWVYNESSTGINSNMFSSSLFQDGDRISLQVLGNEKCTRYLNSNTLKIKVTSAIIPEVKIISSKKDVCPGELLTFNAEVLNKGTEEIFTWKENGTIIGSNSSSVSVSVQPLSNVSLVYNATLNCGTYSKEYSLPSLTFKNSTPVLNSISGPESFCNEEMSVVFTTDFLDQVTYYWKYPSSLGATINNNTISLNFKGSLTTDTLKVKAENECGIGNEIVYVLKPKNCQELFIPNAIISSQEDGNNLWQIKGIESYEKSTIIVYNRWGNKVYSSTGYTKPWDGTIQGKLLPTGTYYYVIEGVQNKPITGSLTIIH